MIYNPKNGNSSLIRIDLLLNNHKKNSLAIPNRQERLFITMQWKKREGETLFRHSSLGLTAIKFFWATMEGNTFDERPSQEINAILFYFCPLLHLLVCFLTTFPYPTVSALCFWQYRSHVECWWWYQETTCACSSSWKLWSLIKAPGADDQHCCLLGCDIGQNTQPLWHQSSLIKWG